MNHDDVLFAATNYLLGIDDPRKRMDAAMELINALDSAYLDAFIETLSGEGCSQ